MLKEYNFIAGCAVSCGCEIYITVESENIEDAEDYAIQEALETFSNFSIEKV